LRAKKILSNSNNFEAEMSYPLQLSFPGLAFESSKTCTRKKAHHFQTLCCSSLQHPSLQEKPDNEVILLERYGNGTAKRYTLDDAVQLQGFLEKNGSENRSFEESRLSEAGLSWLPDIVKDFILPAGFPGHHSITPLLLLLLLFFFHVIALFLTLLLSKCRVGFG
jgi:hypothetical protein